MAASFESDLFYDQPCYDQSLQESLEKQKAQRKELKEADSQRKLAVQEFSKVSERVTELRSHKQRLSRQLRDKEEEMDALNQKVEGLRLDVHKAERAKKEVSVRRGLHRMLIGRQAPYLNISVSVCRWRFRLKNCPLRLRRRRS